MTIKVLLVAALLSVAIGGSDAFAPSSATFTLARTSLSMTPPLRPGEKADTMPFDSSDYFKNRGLDVDLEANKPGALDVQTNVRVIVVVTITCMTILYCFSCNSPIPNLYPHETSK